MSKVQIEEATAERISSYDIIISNVSYPNTFREDIRLDRTMLEDEFANQPAKYAYWSTLSALAKHQESCLKRDMEITYAQEDHNAREEARKIQQEGDTRKFTEKMFEAVAKTSKAYQLAQKIYLEARLLADLLTRAEHAMAQRKEMLISLGAHARVGATDVKVLEGQIREKAQQRRVQQKEETKTTKRRRPTK